MTETEEERKKRERRQASPVDQTPGFLAADAAVEVGILAAEPATSSLLGKAAGKVGDIGSSIIDAIASSPEFMADITTEVLTSIPPETAFHAAKTAGGLAFEAVKAAGSVTPEILGAAGELAEGAGEVAGAMAEVTGEILSALADGLGDIDIS